MAGLCCGIASRAAAIDLGAWMASFASSDFSFRRGTSNVPFPPLMWADYSRYGGTTVRNEGGDVPGGYDQATFTQGAIAPWTIGSRDLLAAGEWISFTRLTGKSESPAGLDVLSVAVPLGWARQATPEWQLAAFVAPLGHRVTSHSAPWYWETMGGFFARYAPQGRWSWIFGAFADVSGEEQFYVPYAGAGFQVDERWTLSLILPWPALLYAPTPDWLLRLGVEPAGTSWALDGHRGTIAIDMDAWNVGLAVERRAWGNLWLRAEAGLSGFRGFGFVGSDWQGPNSGSGTSPYLSLGIGFRPAVTGDRP